MLGVLDLHNQFATTLAHGAAANGTGTGKLIGGGGVPTNLLLAVGAGGGSATITVEESEDDTTYTPLLEQDGTTAVSFAVVAGSANSVLKKIAQRGKKYLRAVQAGVGGTAPVCLLVVEGSVYTAATGKQSGTQVSASAASVAPAATGATKAKAKAEDEEGHAHATGAKGKR